MNHRWLKRTWVRTLPACRAVSLQAANNITFLIAGVVMICSCGESQQGTYGVQFNFSLNSTFTPLRQSSLMPIRYTGARSVIAEAISFVDA